MEIRDGVGLLKKYLRLNTNIDQKYRRILDRLALLWGQAQRTAGGGGGGGGARVFENRWRCKIIPHGDDAYLKYSIIKKSCSIQRSVCVEKRGWGSCQNSKSECISDDGLQN